MIIDDASFENNSDHGLFFKSFANKSYKTTRDVYGEIKLFYTNTNEKSEKQN